jgi:hypothetical protein
MVTGVVFKNIGTTALVFKNIGSGLVFKNMGTKFPRCGFKNIP